VCAGAALNEHLNPSSELPTLPALGAAHYAAAGLMVGAGTRLGNGCTSGHGVCGLARGSRRSFAAVLTFMASGFATMALLRVLEAPAAGVVALPPLTLPPTRVSPAAHAPALALAAAAALISLSAMGGHALLNAALCGVTFGMGLGISGMTHPQKVTGFLDVTGLAGVPWDPSLAFVMGGGLLGSAIGYQGSLRLPSPMLAPKFSLPTRRDLDARLLGGSALFGAGWAVGGMCPGPALANLSLPLFGVSVWGSAGVFCAAMAVAMAAVDVLTADTPPVHGGKKKTKA
jgi:hypothetical protein